MAKPTAASIAAKAKRTEQLDELRTDILHADDFEAVRLALMALVDIIDSLPA